jgi:hypothetical protein
MSGEGATMKDAKADASRKIERAMNADYRPIVITWRNTTKIAVMTPHGYTTRFLDSDCDCTSSTFDREQITQEMMYHIAQNNLWEMSDEDAKEFFGKYAETLFPMWRRYKYWQEAISD